MKITTRVLLLLLTILITGFAVFAQTEPTGADPALTKGRADAAVKIEVFNDYQCPTCAVFDKRLRAIRKKYPRQVQIVYRHYPLTQIHKHAYSAALAVEAAGKQGRFAEMMGILYRNQNKWANFTSTKRTFRNYAKRIGLNIRRFNRDLKSEEVGSRVEADLRRAQSLNLTSTPSIFLNGKLLTFTEQEQLEEMVAKAVP
jgi:protein-disulfide isomerase